MSGGWLSPTFVIGQIKIGTIEGASCLNLGNNVPSGFASRKVHNQGFGSVEGDANRLSGIRSFLHENPAAESGDGEAPAYELPDWIKDWMKESFADFDGDEGAPDENGEGESSADEADDSEAEAGGSPVGPAPV